MNTAEDILGVGETTVEPDHSHLGPSSAERWFACAGSVPLSRRAPKQVAGYAAAEGTKAHELAEWLVTGQKTVAELLALVGTTDTIDGHEVKVIVEMVDGAILYADFINSLVEKIEGQARPAKITRLAEAKVYATSVNKQMYGTADYLLFQVGNVLHVIDYKFGKGYVVEVKENKQMGCYGVAAMDTVAGEAYDEVMLHVVQPRAGHAEGTVRSWQAPKGWMAQFREQLRAAVAATEAPDAESNLNAGPHCRWCPAATMCPELRKAVQGVAEMDFAAVPPNAVMVLNDKGKEEEKQPLPDVSGLSLERLSQVLRWESAIDAFIKACKDRAQAEMERGNVVPFFKVVEGRSNRKWADGTGDAAAKEYEMLYGDAVWEPKKALSVAQMEKLVGKKAFKADEARLTTRPPGRRSIASESDPRPALGASAESDFGALPEYGEKLARPVGAQDDDLLGMSIVQTVAPVQKQVVEMVTAAEADALFHEDPKATVAAVLSKNDIKEAAARALSNSGDDEDPLSGSAAVATVENPTAELEEALLGAKPVAQVWP